jgi:superfamily II DNA or RNA helicase
LLIPRAFWDPVNLPCQVVDCRPRKYTEVDFKSRIKLDHRLKEVDGKKLLVPTGDNVQQVSIDALTNNTGGVLQLACGKGKTVVALEKIARGRVPALVMLDNTQLLYQWQKEAEALLSIPGGIGLFGDGKKEWKKGLVLATYHSIANWADTIPEEARRWFGQVFWDEGHHCFPAGTLVDGIPIEQLQAGEEVFTYNHTRHVLERRQVTCKHVSAVRSLVRVRLAGGKEHVCTPEHPFYTRRGYVYAKDLQASDAVATVEHHVPARNLCLVSETVRAAEEVAEGQRKAGRKRVLLPGAWKTCQVGGVLKDNGEYQPEVCVCAYDNAQPDACRRDTKKSIAGTEGTGTVRTGRERETSERPAPGAAAAIELVTGVRDTYPCEEGLRATDPLQGGHREPGDADSDRGGWRYSPDDQGTDSRQTEDSLLAFKRVDSVEVLEPGSDGTFGGLCSDGFVYNIEVEGNNNYFVEGTLVHNCPAPLFSKTADMFYGARYSLTATPNRDDGLHVLSDGHIGPVLHKDLTPTMKPAFAFLWTGLSPDLRDPSVASKVLDTNGEVHLSKLYSYYGQWPTRVNLLLQAVFEARKFGRMVLVLSNSVDEVVNLMNCWDRPGHPLYTDIPIPTPADVGEQLNPIPLDMRARKKLEAKKKDLQARIKKSSGGDTSVLEAQLSQVEQAEKQCEVARKIQAELEKRQRVYIAELIKGAKDAGMLTYEVDPKTRQRFLAEKNVVFAITKYGKEGMDCPRLDTVILSALFSNRNGLQQLMGRPTRPHIGKKTPVLMAVVDEIGQCLGMTKKLMNHLRSWPTEEGGPYEPILIGFPTSWRTKTRETLTDLFGR